MCDWEDHGKEFHKDYPEREPNGEPTYDSERFRREKDIEYRASKLSVNPILKGPPPEGISTASAPGEYRDLSPTEGKRLCPAREEEWWECDYGPNGKCIYCGVRSTYFDEYND